MPTSVRLDRSDATQVDAIHSDVQIFLSLGFTKPLGHIDFYPNSEQITQPGCSKDYIVRGFSESYRTDALSGFLEGIRYTLSCAHQRAIEFFYESLINNKCDFVAMRCRSYQEFLEALCTCDDSNSSCVKMGQATSVTDLAELELPRHSRYFLLTNNEAPYCS